VDCFQFLDFLQCSVNIPMRTAANKRKKGESWGFFGPIVCRLTTGDTADWQSALRWKTRKHAGFVATGMLAFIKTKSRIVRPIF
jgi:hypothetical protein